MPKKQILDLALSTQIKVEYAADIPEEVRGAIDMTLKPLYQFLPGWIHCLYIMWSPSRNGEAAEVLTNWQYRDARITITELWMLLGRADRRTTMVHEIMHMYTAPLADYVIEIMDKVLGDDKRLLDIVHTEMTTRNEIATQELTRAFNRYV